MMRKTGGMPHVPIDKRPVWHQMRWERLPLWRRILRRFGIVW